MPIIIQPKPGVVRIVERNVPMKLSTFVRMNNIRMDVDYADSNPNAADDEWAQNANHWKCVLKFERRKMTIYFSMGPALHGEPTLEDVLNSLALDASGYENARSFEDWCGEYGYDIDSRKAERSYRQVERQSDKLKRFAADQYETLLYKCESL